MVRDSVANIVEKLREHGFDPRRVGSDSWEAQYPAHRSADHALAVTRDQFNHLAFECRSTYNCEHIRIVRAVLGMTNDQVYAETPDLLIKRLGRFPIPARVVRELDREREQRGRRERGRSGEFGRCPGTLA